MMTERIVLLKNRRRRIWRIARRNNIPDQRAGDVRRPKRRDKDAKKRAFKSLEVIEASSDDENADRAQLRRKASIGADDDDDDDDNEHEEHDNDDHSLMEYENNDSDRSGIRADDADEANTGLVLQQDPASQTHNAKEAIHSKDVPAADTTEERGSQRKSSTPVPRRLPWSTSPGITTRARPRKIDLDSDPDRTDSE
jgi:hypothetical protein